MPPPRLTAVSCGKLRQHRDELRREAREIFVQLLKLRPAADVRVQHRHRQAGAAPPRSRGASRSSNQMPCFELGPPVSQAFTWPWPKPGFTRSEIGPR